LGERDYLWYDTGFWTIRDHLYDYHGCGIDTLSNTLQHIKRGKFVVSLSERSSIIFLKGSVLDGKTTDKMEINIYGSNYVLSIAEVFEPFRAAIRAMGCTSPYSRGWVEPRIIINQELHFKRESYLFDPLAKIRADVPVADSLVLSNDFSVFRIGCLNDLPSLIVQINGGYVPNENDRSVDITLVGNVQTYDDIIVLDISMDYYDSRTSLFFDRTSR
jgi:hypothetical protein